MNKAETCRLIEQIGIVPAIRVSSAEEAHFAAEAVTSGGIPIVEITLTVPRAVELIAHLSHYHPKMLVGAGTVLTIELAQKAWDAGADFVKVFPCVDVGGDRYIRAVKSALPQIPLIPAGGVNQQTAGSYILAGASAIGVGSELIPPEAIERRQAKRIKELSLRFAGFVRDARERVEPPKVVAPGKFKKLEDCEKDEQQ